MALRPDLNGLRVKSPGWRQDAIYLIEGGVRRHIPDPPTYNNLFPNWDGVVLDIDIDDIDLGSPINTGAILGKSFAPAVYLIDGNVKRWITSPDVMDRYYFDWGKIHLIDQVVLDGVPNGPNIDA
jgi:hypothetical protein